MNADPKSYVTLILRDARNLGAVTLLVFTTGWLGVRLAEAVHRWPVKAGRSGKIELRLAKSDRSGEVAFEEGSGYAGWWHCQGNEWKVEWRFKPATAQAHRFEVLVSSSARLTGETIEAVIGEQVLRATIPDLGGTGKWKTLTLGELPLQATPYLLTIRPGSPGLTNLNLKSVTIRPTKT